jgi:ATP-dependent RNA helicase DDX24/MAK5
VFVNSIDSIRRIVPLFELLGVKVWGIHAEMQQRQRLKNLSRFSEEKHCVLISSDVSARGLDIPHVDHVVHYQIPRTADLYVHRSGRTARGGAEGVVVSLCGPGEVKAYRRICHGLQKGGDMEEFPVDYSLLKGIEERLKIAKEIDTAEHKLQKKTHDMSWLRKTAEDADMSFDEEEYVLLNLIVDLTRMILTELADPPYATKYEC